MSLAPARPAPSDVDLAHLEAPDRVSVKPHASPALHAINFLLGRLDESYLPRLREFGGLQSYPSRSKDPDPVDFSTGSVGIGATAVIWRALAHRYVAGHFDVPRGGRVIALLGDAELDEGAVWEAIADPMVAHLGEVLWVVVLTSPDLVFAALQARSGLGPGGWDVLERACPRPRPIVAVVDGHPHTLAFLAAVHGVPIACLGVSRFGQSGDIGDLYRHHGIDAETIVGAALDLAP